jgi:broad specificity phosphatase PhoE
MADSSRRDPDCEIYLVRHAQTEWNASGRWQGHADPPLSVEGRAQALELISALTAELAGDPVSGIVCSDLSRARETASDLGRHFGLIPVSDPNLREMDIGEWSGLGRAEIAARNPELLERFEAGDPDARPPGGETRREIRHRARLAVRRIVDADPCGRIVVVSHLGLIRALLPDADPGNAEFLRLSAADALTRRMRVEREDRIAEKEKAKGPL